MKYLILISILLSIYLCPADDITVYQSNTQPFALVHSSQQVQLTKGDNEIELTNLAKQIKVNSLLLNDNDNGIQILSQNFKPNFARAGNIFENAVDHVISVKIPDTQTVHGILRFYDGQYLGISNISTNEFHLVKEQKVIDFQFPDFEAEQADFNPSISWLVNSSKTQDIELEYSYLTSGIGWNAIYQAIWDDKKNELSFNSLVELTNNCGRDFMNSKVKLVAGDVQSNDQMMNSRGAKDFALQEASSTMGMPVAHSSLSSFHLYTLATPIDSPDRSSRQFQLYPSATIKAEEYFLFNSNGYETKLQKTVAFKNTQENGFGKPIPQGMMNIYTPDRTDGQLQFIGESRIDDTPENKTLVLKLGDAFDLSGETKTMNVQYSDNRRRVESSDYQIVINNNSKEEADILIRHQLDRQLPNIFAADFEYTKKDAFTMEIKLKLSAGSEKTLSWTQKK